MALASLTRSWAVQINAHSACLARLLALGSSHKYRQLLLTPPAGLPHYCHRMLAPSTISPTLLPILNSTRLSGDICALPRAIACCPYDPAMCSLSLGSVSSASRSWKGRRDTQTPAAARRPHSRQG